MTPGGTSTTWATTSSPAASIVNVALRRGSSARTRPRPETPFGMRARLKPSGRRARFEMATRTLSSSQSRTQPIVPSPAPFGLCLTALVSSSFRVSAIGIASTSGRLHADASRPATRHSIGRPKVRCTEPVIASRTLTIDSGPSEPTCRP